MSSYTDRGLGINDLSIGVSTSGLQAYLDELRASLLTEVESKIDDYTTVKSALDKGWQGVSRDNFETNFQEMREKVKEDLRLEYSNLHARIEELAYNYVQQDKNMIVD